MNDYDTVKVKDYCYGNGLDTVTVFVKIMETVTVSPQERKNHCKDLHKLDKNFQN